MTAVAVRKASHQQLRRLLRGGGGTWLEELVLRHSSSSSSPSSPSRRLFGCGAAAFERRRSCSDRFHSLPQEVHHNCIWRSLWPWADGAIAQQVRGVKISGSEVKTGFVIERKGRIEKVLKTQHTTQGRGGATIQVELRDVQTGVKSSARLRTSEAIEKVFVDDKHFTFLYEEDETIYLMDPVTFEQMEVPKTYFETGAVYLKDGMDVTVQYFDGKPLSASVPVRVSCTVAQAEPYFKGQTATPTYKKVVLENGQQIMTPTFISAGDVIVVDTTDDSYVTRSKD